MLTHADVYAKPRSHMLWKEKKTTLQGNGWNTFTCGDEEEECAMDLHRPLAAVTQMETHKEPLRSLQRGLCCLARVPKYTHQGIDLQHLFWEWQLRATAPLGWTWEHSVFHPSNIFCSLQKVIFFSRYQCNLWFTKQIHTKINKERIACK